MHIQTTQYLVEVERLCGPVGDEGFVFVGSAKKHAALEEAVTEMRNTDLTPSRFISGRARVVKRITNIIDTVVEEI